jgi:serine/threonine protein kinase
MMGKAHLLDQNPLRSATTIPEEDWDKRFQTRKTAAESNSGSIRSIFDRIEDFSGNLSNPAYDYFPVLIKLLSDIARAEGRSQVLPGQKAHVQLAMELTNYLKKLLRRQFVLTTEEALELDDDIRRRVRPEGDVRKGFRPAGAPPLVEEVPAPVPVVASPASAEIGAGGYGVVIKPALPNTNEAGVLHEYPDNVTKLFIESENRNKILTLAPLLNRIMGPNEGHRINTYRKAYKGRNVPESSRRKLGIRESNNVFPIRMPDLGVSIHDLLDRRHDLRKIPVTTILSQVVKVLKQVQTLQASGYIHGDIRDTNVMIHPATGAITIIDFDLLRPVEEFRRKTTFGMYNNPPELSVLFPELGQHYIPNFYKMFTFAQELFDGHSFLREMQDVTGKVGDTVSRIGAYSVLTKSLKTFDSFGIACTLLTMFEILYPASIKNDKALLKTSLQARITNNGVPYTDVEMDAIVTAIYDMSHSVLLMLAKFRMDYRPKVEGVIDIAIGIERDLRERLSGVVGNRVGGQRSRTRRNKNRNRKGTRKQ